MRLQECKDAECVDFGAELEVVRIFINIQGSVLFRLVQSAFVKISSFDVCY